jgi:hypothetical protein
MGAEQLHFNGDVVPSRQILANLMDNLRYSANSAGDSAVTVTLPDPARRFRLPFRQIGDTTSWAVPQEAIIIPGPSGNTDLLVVDADITGDTEFDAELSVFRVPKISHEKDLLAEIGACFTQVSLIFTQSGGKTKPGSVLASNKERGILTTPYPFNRIIFDILPDNVSGYMTRLPVFDQSFVAVMRRFVDGPPPVMLKKPAYDSGLVDMLCDKIVALASSLGKPETRGKYERSS